MHQNKLNNQIILGYRVPNNFKVNQKNSLLNRGWFDFKKEKKQYTLQDYPVLITAGAGGGKTQALLAIADQCIEQSKGVIYLDAKNDSNIYAKVFSCADRCNRLKDLYVLNFTNSKIDSSCRQLHSHTIDPINPMSCDVQYFCNYFGQQIGEIIHAVLLDMHAKDQLMSIEQLEQSLVLENLFSLLEDKSYNKSKLPISSYINYLTSSNNSSSIQAAHNEMVKKAHDTISALKSYSNVFQTNEKADVKINDVFLNKKILLVLTSPKQMGVSIKCNVGEMILSQVLSIEKNLFKMDKTISLQHILIDEFTHYARSLTELENVKTPLILSTHINNMDQKIVQYVFSKSNTYVLMRGESYIKSTPQGLWVELCDYKNVKIPLTPTSLMPEFSYKLLSLQYPGQAVVIKNSKKPKTMPCTSPKDVECHIEMICCLYNKDKDVNPYLVQVRD